MNRRNRRISTAAMLFMLATLSLVGQVLAQDDRDQDGLPDSWEIHYFGDLRQGADDDPDGDGFSNLAEYLDGTSPIDPNDRPDPPHSNS
jgi:hypothetical protein